MAVGLAKREVRSKGPVSKVRKRVPLTKPLFPPTWTSSSTKTGKHERSAPSPDTHRIKGPRMTQTTGVHHMPMRIRGQDIDTTDMFEIRSPATQEP